MISNLFIVYYTNCMQHLQKANTVDTRCIHVKILNRGKVMTLLLSEFDRYIASSTDLTQSLNELWELRILYDFMSDHCPLLAEKSAWSMPDFIPLTKIHEGEITIKDGDLMYEITVKDQTYGY